MVYVRFGAFQRSAIFCLTLSILGSGIAQAAEGCLTNVEARKLWATEHLYWHTNAHCWDNLDSKTWKMRSPFKLNSDGYAFSTITNAPSAGLLYINGTNAWFEMTLWIWMRSFEKLWYEEMAELNGLILPEMREFGFVRSFD